MIKGLSAVWLALVGLVAAFPQDQDDLQKLLEKALVISMEIRVTDRNSKSVMTMQAMKVAISGERFPVTLDGRSIRGSLLFTPYEEADGRVLLVAQVQLWIKETSSTDWKYLTSLKSIPAALNETIRFFPLGVDDSIGTGNIELDIKVGRYKDYLEKMKQPSPRTTNPPGGWGGTAP